MSQRIPLRTWLCITALGCSSSCTSSDPTSPPAPPAAPPTAVPSEGPWTTTQPPRPFDETLDVRHRRLTTPPVEGLEYWADAPLTTESVLARAEAFGIDIEHTVEVDSIPALLRALAPNTAIVLTPGRHEFRDSHILAPPEVKAKLPEWSTLSPYYDFGEIHDLHDLLILGPGPSPTVILQSDGYAHALSFRQVNGLGLHNLTIGHHPDQGWCKGGVVKIVQGTDVLITDSTLFGSGTEGLSLVTVDGLRFQDSVITNSSEQFSTISQSRRVFFERVRIVGNTSDLLRGFAIYHSMFTMSDSTIADNKPLSWSSADSYGLLFAIDGTFDWGSWFVDRPKVLEPERQRSEVTLHNTTIDGERHDERL